MTSEDLNRALRLSLDGHNVEDYTFEERYLRGVDRVVRPKQDEVCIV